ncbi:MAG: MarR family transcriptional regulator [Ignavibacteria bacterium]|nr:MarR family transcriptional regulator [Ignavibacteria bacterium]
MSTTLNERIKQTTFSSEYQEAMLSILVAADYLNTKMQQACEEFDITSTQYNVLRILNGVYPEGHPRCEIIARMIQTAPDVTRLIDRLVNAGFAKRTKSTLDARLSVTIITPKGRDLLSKLTPIMQRFEQDVRKKLKGPEAKSLTKICSQIFSD